MLSVPALSCPCRSLASPLLPCVPLVSWLDASSVDCPLSIPLCDAPLDAGGLDARLSGMDRAVEAWDAANVGADCCADGAASVGSATDAFWGVGPGALVSTAWLDGACLGGGCSPNSADLEALGWPGDVGDVMEGSIGFAVGDSFSRGVLDSVGLCGNCG